jgi:hypothetical protein
MAYDNFDHDAWQVFREAIEEGDLATVDRLLADKPELLHLTAMGSCLHIAAAEGKLPVVERFVDLGADINQAIEIEGTPLEQAASGGHLDVVKYLVKRGASLAVPHPDFNPLYSAIYEGHTDVVRFLLSAGLDPAVVYRSESGRLSNALSFARRMGRTEIAEALTKAGCRLPVEGVDKPVWQPEGLEESAADSNHPHERIVAHIAEKYGAADPQVLQEILPVHDEVHVKIHVVRPNDTHPFLTLFTTGMSDRPMAAPAGEEAFQYAELVMHLPPTWQHPQDPGAAADTFWPFEWMRKVAYFPHLHHASLGGQWTIISSDEPPVPLGANTKQTCLLLLADFGGLDPLELGDGKSVRFYTVVPLYTEERDFEKRRGMVALLQRLEKSGFTAVVGVNRPNVADK